MSGTDDVDARIRELAERFLEAFRAIEQRLRTVLVQGDGRIEFARLLNQAQGDRAIG